MVLDAALLSTEHYKVMIKGKVKQSRESVVAIVREAFEFPSTTVANFTALKFKLYLCLTEIEPLYLLTFKLRTNAKLNCLK